MKDSRSIAHTVVASVLVLGSAVTVEAGQRKDAFVVINSSTRTASGSMGSARQSPGSVQSIGCSVVYPPHSPQWGTCVATNSAGTTATCAFSSNGTGVWDLLSALGDDAYITFKWNAAGACTSLEIQNYSYYMPKQN